MQLENITYKYIFCEPGVALDTDFPSRRFGVRSLSRYQLKFSKYFNRGSGGSEPALNCRSHHKEVNDL